MAGFDPGVADVCDESLGGQEPEGGVLGEEQADEGDPPAGRVRVPGCFLLKRRELLADAEHQLCRDCAAWSPVPSAVPPRVRPRRPS